MSLRHTLKKLCRNNQAMVTLEVAFATPLLLGLALGGIEVTNYILFTQKIDRAVTTVADLTAQARGLSVNDLDSIYDAAEYIMRPHSFDQNSSVIVSAISHNAQGNTRINWQWNSAQAVSRFGTENTTPTLPDAFLVREGESVIVSEIFMAYDPIILDTLFPTTPLYQYAIYRPRFDALTELN